MKSLGLCIGLLVAGGLAAQEPQHHWSERDARTPSFSERHEQGWPAPSQPEAPPFAFPEVSGDDLVVFADLASFLDATDDLAPLRHETFERNLIAADQLGQCFNPLDHASDDACVRPGDLDDGVRLRSSWGNFTDSWLVLMDPGLLGTPTPVIGTNAFNDPVPNPTRIEFFEPPTAVAMEVYDGNLGGPVAVSVLATDGTLIGSFTLEPEGTNLPEFAGLRSQVPIGRVEVVGTLVGSGELIGDLRFGGGPGRLRLDPAVVEFGPVAAGDQAVMAASVENEGHLAVDLGGIDDPSPPFELVTDDCSQATLQPGDSCALEVAFAPAVDGDSRAEIAIPADTPGAGATIVAEGTAMMPALTATPAAIAFEAEVGATDSGIVELVNHTGVTAMVAAIDGVAGPFEQTGGSCGLPPFDLSPGQACSLDFSFAPTASGRFVNSISMRTATDSELIRIHLGGTATGD